MQFHLQLGLKLFGKEKPHLLKDLSVDFKDLHSHLLDTEATADDLHWEGAMEIDMIIYPTMKGILELNQRGKTYYLQSKLIVPHGVVYLVDEFYYQVSYHTITVLVKKIYPLFRIIYIFYFIFHNFWCKCYRDFSKFNCFILFFHPITLIEDQVLNV